jgi:hypothetical protein
MVTRSETGQHWAKQKRSINTFICQVMYMLKKVQTMSPQFYRKFSNQQLVRFSCCLFVLFPRCLSWLQQQSINEGKKQLFSRLQFNKFTIVRSGMSCYSPRFVSSHLQNCCGITRRSIAEWIHWTILTMWWWKLWLIRGHTTRNYSKICFLRQPQQQLKIVDRKG